MRTMRYQPQGAARLDRRNKFAANALAVLSAAHGVNLATGKPAIAAGANFQRLGSPAGLALAFRKNFYIESEPLPAIGTASFVEYWVGYPGAGGAQGASDVPSFLTGSSANRSGIFSVRGTGFDSGNGSPASWGAVYQWDGTIILNSAEDVLTAGVLTVLVVVRRQSGMEFWRNGRLVRSIAQAPISIPAQTLIGGGFVEDAFWTSASDMVLAGRALTPAEPSAAEIKEFSANVWQQFLASHDDGDEPANVYTLKAAPGTFTLGSAPARLPITRRLVAASGAASLAGSPAALLAQRMMPAASGMHTLTGRAAGLIAARRIAVDAGMYSLAGAGAPLLTARRLTAGLGVFGLAGGGVQMVYTPTPSPTGPTYTLTATSGGFALAGAAVRLAVARRLATAVGGYAMQGVAVQVRAVRRVVALPGSFALAGAVAVLKYSTSGPRLDISKISPARVVVFEGSGSRIVVFEGSGKRMRFNDMAAKVPTKENGKWVIDRDPDEKSYYAADITDELSDRFTTLDSGADAVELILQGVTQLGAHSIQVANVSGVDRTYIVVLLGGVEGALPKDWLWCARVKCANGERFDKTTWFNRVDT